MLKIRFSLKQIKISVAQRRQSFLYQTYPVVRIVERECKRINVNAETISTPPDSHSHPTFRGRQSGRRGGGRIWFSDR